MTLGLLDLELDGDFVDRDNFPLPRLQLVLQKLSLKIHNGHGFYILRGLDLSKYTVGDGMIIFLGIQSYIAEERARQDDVGNVIGGFSFHPDPYWPMYLNAQNYSYCWIKKA